MVEEGASRGLSSVSGQSFGFFGPKILIGRNIAVSAVTTALKDLKIKKPFIVTGKGGVDRLRESLLVPTGALSSGTSVSADEDRVFCISGEPTVRDAREATAKAKAAGCDGVLSVGEWRGFQEYSVVFGEYSFILQGPSSNSEP